MEVQRRAISALLALNKKEGDNLLYSIKFGMEGVETEHNHRDRKRYFDPGTCPCPQHVSIKLIRY